MTHDAVSAAFHVSGDFVARKMAAPAGVAGFAEGESA